MGERELLHAPEVIIPAAEQMILCASARVMVAQLDERKRERETRIEIKIYNNGFDASVVSEIECRKLKVYLSFRLEPRTRLLSLSFFLSMRGLIRGLIRNDKKENAELYIQKTDKERKIYIKVLVRD